MQATHHVWLTQPEREIVQKAMNYLAENVRDSISADALSEAFNLPVKKLQEGMRLITGRTVHRYHLQFKIKRAKELLSENKMPIKNIYREVGFSNASHFSQAFKKETGLKPMEYRKLYAS